MTDQPLPPGGHDAEEPEGPAPMPSRGDGPPAGEEEMPPEEAGQGLFVCVPAGPTGLAGFGAGDAGAVETGPVLAGVAAAVAGGDGAGLAQASEDCLFSVLAAGRRMSSWGTWLELAAMHELALRHPATQDRTSRQKRAAGIPETPAKDQPAAKKEPAAQKPGAGGTAAAATSSGPAAPAADGRFQFSEFISDEVAVELRLTWTGAADRMSYACDLAGRLPVTFAALGAGLIDPVHAKIIYEQTGILSAADAAKADPVLAAAAQAKTYGELRAAAAKLVLKLDPDAHERRKQANRREAHVRPFREESGNAGMIARELPSDEVLASWQHVEQRALDLRAAGVPG